VIVTPKADVGLARRARWLLGALGLLVAALTGWWLAPDSRLAVGRMLGKPIPTSVHNVHFYTDEMLLLTPEPSYELRFEAAADEVAALLKREGFRVDESPATSNWGKSEWMRHQGRPQDLVGYQRARKPPGCVVEYLWWDAARGVVYQRACS